MIDLSMTSAETSDFHGLDPVTADSPWGRFRVRAQHLANETRRIVRVLTCTGVVVCVVDPLEEC